MCEATAGSHDRVIPQNPGFGECCNAGKGSRPKDKGTGAEDFVALIPEERLEKEKRLGDHRNVVLKGQNRKTSYGSGPDIWIRQGGWLWMLRLFAGTATT